MYCNIVDKLTAASRIAVDHFVEERSDGGGGGIWTDGICENWHGVVNIHKNHEYASDGGNEDVMLLYCDIVWVLCRVASCI